SNYQRQQNPKCRGDGLWQRIRQTRIDGAKQKVGEIIPNQTIQAHSQNQSCQTLQDDLDKSHCAASGLTKKAEPLPTNGVNRDSGTDSANGGWLRRLVRHTAHCLIASSFVAAPVIICRAAPK